MKKKYTKRDIELMSLEEMNKILSEFDSDEVLEFNEDNLNKTFLFSPVSIAQEFLKSSEAVQNPKYYHYTNSNVLKLFTNEIEAKIFALDLVEDLLKSDNRLEV